MLKMWSKKPNYYITKLNLTYSNSFYYNFNAKLKQNQKKIKFTLKKYIKSCNENQNDPHSSYGVK